MRGHFDAVAAAAGQGRLLRDGLTVVLAGRPNSGKSSLLNRLAGYDAAIVTAVPGTTRDVLRERIDIDGLPLHVLDTAGLRDSDDVVEREGVRRAAAEMSRADRVLFVIDTRRRSSGSRLRGRACPPARRGTRHPGVQQDRSAAACRWMTRSAGPPRIHVSATDRRRPRPAARPPQGLCQLPEPRQRQHFCPTSSPRGTGARPGMRRNCGARARAAARRRTGGRGAAAGAARAGRDHRNIYRR